MLQEKDLNNGALGEAADFAEIPRRRKIEEHYPKPNNGSDLYAIAHDPREEPLKRYGAMGAGMASDIAHGAWDQIKKPGEALRGEYDPSGGRGVGASDEAVQWAANTALGALGGGTAFNVAPEGAIAANGIRAYHGSPHKFDKFDYTKIGSGEGAQAYGHGLYFAGNEDVARGYANNAADKYSPQSIARRMLANQSRDEAIQKQIEQIKRLEGNHTEEFIQPYRGALDILKSGEVPKIGNMYEVKINENPEHLLDWDKPLTSQPRAMQGLNQYIDELGGEQKLRDFSKELEEKRRQETEAFSRAWDSDEPLHNIF
jgi:hypothetical protein